MSRRPQPTWPARGLADAQDEHGLGSGNQAVVLRVLARRHTLRQRDRWTPQQLHAHQARVLRQVREHAYAYPRFYRRFHAGRTDRPLHELPVLTKAMVMKHFDDLGGGCRPAWATTSWSAPTSLPASTSNQPPTSGG